MWGYVRSWLQTSWAPSTFADVRLLTSNLHGGSKRIFWVGLGALCWSLWTIRNKFTIEGVFPNTPTDILFKISILLRQWKLLTKHVDRDGLKVAKFGLLPILYPPPSRCAHVVDVPLLSSRWLAHVPLSVSFRHACHWTLVMLFVVVDRVCFWVNCVVIAWLLLCRVALFINSGVCLFSKKNSN